MAEKLTRIEFVLFGDKEHLGIERVNISRVPLPLSKDRERPSAEASLPQRLHQTPEDTHTSL